MLSFFLATAALLALVYYIFGGEEPEETTKTSAPAKRDAPETTNRNVGPSKKTRGPNIHVQKVREQARDAFRSARTRAEHVEEKGELDELARESYFLAQSLRKMFSSDEFFEKRTRFDSFRTAIKATEDARDRLIDRQKKELRRTDAEAPSASDYVKDKYARHATESALMIAWCAGGLIGKSRYESAQEAFHVSVSTEDVQSWKRFGQIVRKESEHYMASPTKG